MSLYDGDQVRDWVHRLYTDLPGHLAISYQDAGGRFHAGTFLTDPDDVVRYVEQLEQQRAHSVYLRVATVSERPPTGERGSAALSLGLPALWADIDIEGPGHKHDPAKQNGRRLPPTVEAAREIVAGSGLPAPSVVVHTGGGVHAYWQLDPAAVLDDDNRAPLAYLSMAWQAALQRSAHTFGWEYGTGVGDLARVLRLPGTVNRKAGLERPCRVILDTGATYDLRELAALHAVQPAVMTPAATAGPAPAPRPPRVDLGLTPGRSAFDTLDEHVTFDDLLTGAGWTLHRDRHGPAVAQCWTRPGDPEHACSAHTLTAMPEVLVVLSDAAGLPTGGGQRLTRGRLFAHLHHGGDERAASLDLFAAIGGRPSTQAAGALPLPRTTPSNRTHPPSADGVGPVTVGDLADLEVPTATPSPPAEVGPPHTPPAFDLERDDFWTSRPELAHLRDFARARRAAPWAVLGCALARIVAHVEPFVTLPPTIGGDASLNLFVGLVGPSGGGKGAAEAAAKDALRYGPSVALPLVEAGVGSGEGLAHSYLRYVPGKNGAKGTMEQHTTRVLFRAPEVDTLAALKGRQGSTLLPKLRDAWIGDALGFAYADVTRRLDLRAHAYRMCLIVGIQPARAAALLDDSDGGTPQRFLWLPTMDPNVPDVAPATPEPYAWRHPPLGPIDPRSNRHRITVCEAARRAVDQAAIDRHKGNVDALDGHALLNRLKTAAALALLNERTDVTDDDWALAGVVMTISNHTRAGIVTTMRDHRYRAAVARGRADGVVSMAAEEVRDEAAATRVSHGLIRKLTATWTPHNQIRKQLAGRDRQHFDAALDRLLASGLVEAQTIDRQGGQGVEYRLTRRAA